MNSLTMISQSSILAFTSWEFSPVNRIIGLVSRVFANGPGDLGSKPGRVIPKISKMVLDSSLPNTQQYNVRIEGKVEKSRERSSVLLHFGVIVIEKGVFWSPSTTVAKVTLLIYERQEYEGTGSKIIINAGK